MSEHPITDKIILETRGSLVAFALTEQCARFEAEVSKLKASLQKLQTDFIEHNYY